MIRLSRRFRNVPFFLCALISLAEIFSADVPVQNRAELVSAVRDAVPGTRILIAGGDYGAGFYFKNLRGEKGSPIVLTEADTNNPPVFANGGTAIQLSNPAYVELEGLVLRHLDHNGVNIDDGNQPAESACGVILRRLHITDIGGDGNNDGIKLSGLWDFQIAGCVVERWGTKGGSAVDMVGCHRGTIEGNTIRHNFPAPPNCTGVQTKGGTSDIVIRENRFENAGGRSVNIGGSTGLQFFRPPLEEGQEYFEARNIVVERNIFKGSVAPIAFVGVDGADVRFNRIEHPERWAIRILQETKAAGFVPCRNGNFTDNTILFDSRKWAEGGVNIGADTAPETFQFARNRWFCEDNPQRSRPKLPTPEQGGVYGVPIGAASRPNLRAD